MKAQEGHFPENVKDHDTEAGYGDASPTPGTEGPTPQGRPAEAPPEAQGLGFMFYVRMSLRILEFILCLVAFSLAAASNENVKTLAWSQVAFLLAMAVIVCIYAMALAVLFVLLLTGAASFSVLESLHITKVQLVSDFVLTLLLFGASCSVASVVTPGSSWRFESLLSGAAAMGFLASFCLAADFWLTLLPVFGDL